MTEGQASKAAAAMFADEWAAAWMEEHLPELKQSASGQRVLYISLAISFVVGLAAHVGGYALLSSVPVGLLGLFADLLHALGWSLWTGVVVALFVQVIPEVKRRQIKEAVEAYEALRSQNAEAGPNREKTVLERSHSKRADRVRGKRRPRKGS